MVVSRFFIALQKRLLRENTLAKAIKAKVNDWKTVFCGFDGFGELLFLFTSIIISKVCVY